MRAAPKYCVGCAVADSYGRRRLCEYSYLAHAIIGVTDSTVGKIAHGILAVEGSLRAGYLARVSCYSSSELVDRVYLYQNKH
jgi:hypothetical protein